MIFNITLCLVNGSKSGKTENLTYTPVCIRKPTMPTVRLFIVAQLNPRFYLIFGSKAIVSDYKVAIRNSENIFDSLWCPNLTSYLAGVRRILSACHLILLENKPGIK